LEAELAVQRQLQDNAIKLSDLYGSRTGKGTFAKTSIDKLPDWLKFSCLSRFSGRVSEVQMGSEGGSVMLGEPTFQLDATSL